MRRLRIGGVRVRVHRVAALALLSAASAAAQQPEDLVPPVTPADRAAAFPDVGHHDPRSMMLERPLNYYVLLDQLEAVDTDPDRALAWDVDAWIGRDLSRLVVRSEGQRVDGRTEAAELQLLWSRSFSRWWSWVAGARMDFAPGSDREWAAFGVEGLAPQWFEVEATAYVGDSGDTALRVEAEHEERLTNRLKLQPRIEVEWHGQDDAGRGIGAGLSSAEVGFRLRYEIRPEVAPYVGVAWERKYGRTADFARAAGDDGEDSRIVAGVRLWF